MPLAERGTPAAMIVLITGCRSGFGLLTAVAAAKAGHRVYAGLRDVSTADGLRAAAKGLAVEPVQLDVTNAEQREQVVASILEREGRIDALVNNAGVALGGFQEQVAEDELRQVFEVNVFGLWALTKCVLPTMREQKSGVIVNVSSMAGRMAMPGLGIYASSKFAVEGMSESLRHELRPFGIRVVLVEPGPYETDIFSRNRRMCRGAQAREGEYAAVQTKLEAFMEKRFAKGGMGDPNEVSELIVRLLDDANPKLRYPLGPSTQARLWMRRLLPFWAEEKLLDRIIGL